MFEKLLHTFLFVVSVTLISIGIVQKDFTSAWLIYLFFSIYLLNLIMALIIYQSDRIYDAKISWILGIFIFPLLGAVLYYIFGRPYKYAQARTTAISLQNDMVNHESWNESSDYFSKNIDSVMKLTSSLSKRPVYTESSVKYLRDGVDKFSELLLDLKDAKKYIHIQYFIIKESEIWNKIEEVLVEKVKEGVEVRVLADGLGTIKFPRKKIKELREIGIDFKWYKKMSFSATDNYRNHRKMVIIDGEVGYTGGINIGDEYVHKSKHFGYWRDSALKLRGSCLRTLQLIFLMDWKTATKLDIPPNTYLRYIKPVKPSTKTSVIIADDGPGIGAHVFMDVITKMILDAKKRIWITSPYLILTDAINSSLRLAVKSGVDVRIIIPGKPDKKAVYAASLNNARILARDGVKVFKYSKNFIHAKQLLIDDQVIVGTSNFDKRSFTQNYELFVVVNNVKMTEIMESEFDNDIRRSRLISESITDDMRLLDGIKSLFLKLLSPLF